MCGGLRPEPVLRLKAHVDRSGIPGSEASSALKSWQIVPSILSEMPQDPEAARLQRVLQALLKMRKLDIEGFGRVFERG